MSIDFPLSSTSDNRTESIPSVPAQKRISWSKVGVLIALFATAVGGIAYLSYQNPFMRATSPTTLPPQPLPKKVLGTPTLNALSELFAKVRQTESSDNFHLTCASRMKSRNEILGKELGSLYEGPITDLEEIKHYVPEGNSKVLGLDPKEKVELFVAKSGVPIIAHHRECFSHLCDYTIPYEAVYSAVETVDMLMERVEPHIRKRVLDTRLYVHITDPSTFGLQDYSGWFRTADKKTLMDNEIAISPNAMLPKVDICQPQFKPGTSKRNALVHEFTHAVQALLPYRESREGPVENWVDLTDFPPRIWNAISAQLKKLPSPDIDINDPKFINRWVKEAAEIDGLSEDDVHFAKDIAFNRNVQAAYENAKLNPSYQEPINPKATFGDYQFAEVPGSNWHHAGTEYFAELAAGAFNMNKDYAFQKVPSKAFTGRMSTPQWIKDNDKEGWELLTQKYRQIEHVRFCVLPLLKTMPFCH